jgi:parallel beta-helix repeat protein
MRIRSATLIVAGLAVAGGVLVTPPAKGAETVACGQGVDHSIVLAGPIGCPGDGLVVEKDGITIDLGGHSIAGDVVPGSAGATDIGIDVGAFKDVTIRGGLVVGFDEGISSSGAGLRVQRVVTRRNTFRGILSSGPRAVIVRSTARDNGDIGISVTGKRGLVDQSAATENGFSGIRTGPNATVRDSTSSGNEGVGVRIGGPASIIGSVISRNNANGITAIISTTATIEDNDVTGNRGAGISVFGTEWSVTGNRVSDNGLPEIFSVAGIVIVGDRNVVERNSFVSNTHDGILVKGNENVIRNNNASGNDDDGIDFERAIACPSTGNRLIANRTDGNGFPAAAGAGDDVGLGINAASTASTSAKDNLARGNDNPVECDPVTFC